jgi:hypothetical protein
MLFVEVRERKKMKSVDYIIKHDKGEEGKNI